MIHVRPAKDAIEHELTERCVCGPAVERTEGFNGDVAYMITHHPLVPAPTYPAEAGEVGR